MNQELDGKRTEREQAEEEESAALRIKASHALVNRHSPPF